MTKSFIQPNSIERVAMFIAYFKIGQKIDGADLLAMRSLQLQYQALALHNRVRLVHAKEAKQSEALYLIANFVFATINEHKHYPQAENLLFTEPTMGDVFPDVSCSINVETDVDVLVRKGRLILDYCEQTIAQMQSLEHFVRRDESNIFESEEVHPDVVRLFLELQEDRLMRSGEAQLIDFYDFPQYYWSTGLCMERVRCPRQYKILS